MNRIVNHIAVCTALFVVPVPVNAARIVVPEGTGLAVELKENINGNLNHGGEAIEFSIADDVVVSGEVVFKKGSPVSGFISNVEGRKSLGRSGELSFQMRHARAVDGTDVRLFNRDISLEGRQRTGATVAHTVMWGPLGLFAKGRAAFAFKETLYDIETDREVTIDTDPVIADAVATAPGSRFIKSEISSDTGKFKFSKGKPGKNLKLKLSDQDVIAQVRANPSMAVIYQIDGYQLPDPIPSMGVYSGYKKRSEQDNEYFEYDFWEVVKYSNPGTTDMKLRFTLEDGSVVESETQLELEWKVK